MVNDKLQKLLDEYKVDKEISEVIKEDFREPLEDTIKKAFFRKPNFRYGGSIAKHTANSVDCDLDLLCYCDPEEEKTVEEIYNTVYDALTLAGYWCEKKNSAIVVFGTMNGGKWDMTVDVVPGKYTSNDENKDVYLWCNKTNSKLKSNPEKQINKVKESNVKDVIRLIKLFRHFSDFRFKSFILEIFAIDVVQPLFKEGDSTYDKLIKFCSNFAEIGVKKLYDPANSNNDLSDIHTSFEFQIIRDKIKALYEVLLTDNDEAIINALKGEYVDIDNAYCAEAKSHSYALTLIPKFSGLINLKCYDDNGNEVSSGQPVTKGINLTFKITVPDSFDRSNVKLIVSNSGYEARFCKRGNAEQTTRLFTGKYRRNETTSYNGNHCVQAYVDHCGNRYYSSLFIVKIRDF